MADFSYKLDKRLLVIPVLFHGKYGSYDAELIVDTGASLTILQPLAIHALGFSQVDQTGISTVQSPIGKESGFRVRLPAIECLGRSIKNFEVACHDVGLKHLDGLLGMNFLEQFDFCIYPRKGVIRI